MNRHQIATITSDDAGFWHVTCICGWQSQWGMTRQEHVAHGWFEDHAVAMFDLDQPALPGFGV